MPAVWVLRLNGPASGSCIHVMLQQVWFYTYPIAAMFPPNVVITALVAVIHRGTGGIYQDNATPVEPWITGTSPVLTVLEGFGKVQCLNPTAVNTPGLRGC